MRRTRRTLTGGMLLAAAISMTATGLADTLRLRDGREVLGQYEGGDARVIRFRTDAGVREFDVLSVAGVRIADAVAAPDREPVLSVARFSADEIRLIRDWFSANRRGNLPPGLARRDSLPPGLERQLQRNGTLPPGLEKRLEPLPWDLERRLPQAPEGTRRVVVGVHVVLLEDRTSRVVDLIRGVL